VTQYRKGLITDHRHSTIKAEIEANEKLVRCKDSYGLSDAEDSITRENPSYYKTQLERIDNDSH
jgi:hypothetical protein